MRERRRDAVVRSHYARRTATARRNGSSLNDRSQWRRTSLENELSKLKPDPTLDDLVRLFSNEDHGAFLKGHLLVEAVLFAMLRTSEPRPSRAFLRELTFAGAVAECERRAIVTPERVELLRAINRTRNAMAHELRYEFSFEEAYELVQEAGRADVDFSDGTVFGDQAEVRALYGTPGLLQELFQNFVQDFLFDHDPDMQGPTSAFWSTQESTV